MQVQSYQTNNYQTNFGAKLQLKSIAPVEELSKNLVSKIEKVVNKIGNDNDIIFIEFGPVYNNYLRQPHAPARIIDTYRKNNIVTYINGKIELHPINSNCDEPDGLSKSILKFLKKMTNPKNK